MTSTSTASTVGMPVASFANRKTRTSERVEQTERRWRRVARAALTRVGLAHVGTRRHARSDAPTAYGAALAATLGLRLPVFGRDLEAMGVLAADSDPTRCTNEHEVALEADAVRKAGSSSHDPIAGSPKFSHVSRRIFRGTPPGEAGI
jgi:hypothetical protein